ncbi:MAG: EVE domain-containing protein [Alphaproteobacteria bacterium]|jgi:predicted RNA-binding protein with PUA-like domain|nr:EVE domain-containing protein [Alphaproteobacteria bacterium]
MAYWLFKSEPGSYSWERLVKDKRTHWNGVRNYQANNNMKAMKKGDRGFFYHSVDEKDIVGVVEVVKEHYPDDSDATGRFGMVDVKAVMPVKNRVSLAAIKAEPGLEKLALVRQGRLSVVPVSAAEWKILCRMAGITA